MRKRIFAVILLCIACVFALSGCGYSSHKVKDKNALETDVFLDKPDSMAVISGGKEKSLGGEDLDEVYASFTALMESYKGFDTMKSRYDSKLARAKFVNEHKDSDTCVEFRYNRRRKYTGKLPAVGDYGELTEFTNKEFDAMLFVFDTGSPLVLPYCDGSYRFTVPHSINFPKEAGDEFVSLLKAKLG